MVESSLAADVAAIPSRSDFGTADPLSRFYSKPPVADGFAALFATDMAKNVLDLGCGEGSLTLPVTQRWGSSAFVTVDKDPAIELSLRRRLRPAGRVRHQHHCLDAFSLDLPQRLGRKFDVLLSNPPYQRVERTSAIERIFADAGLTGLMALPPEICTAELVFLAQMLRVAKSGAELGMIVPDGLMTSFKNASVRRALLQRVAISKVVSLEPGSFLRTSAQAYALMMRNEPGGTGYVNLHTLDEDGLSQPLQISPQEAARRLDHAYYALRPTQMERSITLRELRAEIVRGYRTSVEIRKKGGFHTTSFPKADEPREIHLDEAGAGKKTDARAGDILLARVGRSSHEKIGLVERGSSPLSDCVYAIRIPQAWRRVVLTSLLSPGGQRALRRISCGVGPRVIRKADLLDLPLPI
ncbi:Site-specific DNA-methyltransferase (adenine-specific) [Hyphomicrobiales bacterium]|nr:Site-specific DNA-methyltransferase (adenine-specific) [Hyphomicrobiales bacterium]CAH1702432.1 Site-specific DNA-methyltransferase (adenine-specific) [Hyphomicrobiales bacterium]CAI0346632.1 Site-specific DNA-methyltransferase (adenine-specific) [Hyphomicrobiales bacterium]